jgi:hypothetical protein
MQQSTALNLNNLVYLVTVAFGNMLCRLTANVGEYISGDVSVEASHRARPINSSAGPTPSTSNLSPSFNAV